MCACGVVLVVVQFENQRSTANRKLKQIGKKLKGKKNSP